MSFTLTIDDSSIDYTRPTYFHGWHRQINNRGSETDDPDYLTQVRRLGAEILRQDTSHGGFTDSGANALAKALAKDFSDHGAAIFMKAYVNRPQDLTSIANYQWQDPNNINSGAGWSPNAARDIVDDWISSGIDVKWCSPWNEPSLQKFMGQYFGSGTSAAYRAETFAAMADRVYADAVHELHPEVGFILSESTEGRTRGSLGDPFENIDGFLLKGHEDTAQWPWGSSRNVDYQHFTEFGHHFYPKTEGHSGAPALQLLFNDIFYNGGTPTQGSTSNTRYSLQLGETVRERLALYGYPECGVMATEGGISGGDLSVTTWGMNAALCDVLLMISALAQARPAAAGGVGRTACILHNLTSTIDGGCFIVDGPPFTPSIRLNNYADMVRPFFEDAHDVLETTFAGGHTTAGDNGVQAIQYGVLRNSAADEVRLLVANCDTDAGGSETGVLNLAFEPTGPVTRVELNQSTGNGASPASTTVSLHQGGNSISLAGGSARLYIIPRPVSSPPSGIPHEFVWYF